MHIIADTHVHIYPNYKLSSVFEYAIKNLSDLISKDEPKTLVLCLTEKEPHNFFEGLKRKKLLLPPPFRVVDTPENDTLSISLGDKNLFVIAGRQLRTREGLEVHALGSALRFKDGLSLLESIEMLLKAAAVVVIPWSPGKWFFQRGEVVKEALQRFGPRALFIADSRLRPTFWRTPRLIQEAKLQGFRTLAGSDPLPFPNEERWIGTFAIKLEGNISNESPRASFVTLLNEQHISLLGKRCDTLRFLCSNMALRLNKAYNQ